MLKTIVSWVTIRSWPIPEVQNNSVHEKVTLLQVGRSSGQSWLLM
jgi:hypothetical protein